MLNGIVDTLEPQGLDRIFLPLWAVNYATNLRDFYLSHDLYVLSYYP